MLQFPFFSWNYKNDFPSILFHFLSHLVSLQTFEINFPKSADMWLIQTKQIFYCKINKIRALCFLISVTPAFLLVAIWYSTVV